MKGRDEISGAGGLPLERGTGRRLIRERPAARRLCLDILLLAVIVFCVGACGQTYSIGWYRIAGGGGTSSGGAYEITGTIGQEEAGGPMAGGNYSLAGGFWAVIAVVQMPGAPVLYVSHSGGMVEVSWRNVAGWTLQQNNDVVNTGGWAASSGWTTTNGTNHLNIAMRAGNLFFRLAGP